MTYTSTDLAKVQAAIVAQAKGQRHTQVSSWEKMIKYAKCPLLA